MAMIGRLIRLASNPQSRKLLNEAQNAARKAAKDPKNRERLLEVRSRLRKRLS